uniref:Uncharacterized protein n=1 Tax=Rhizophora mucronata TaxID=61149 RepID=A0A2P2P859_RHIMU
MPFCMNWPSEEPIMDVG